jgi:prepilin-type N-terminal cleavage/methylation domain-containing protein
MKRKTLVRKRTNRFGFSLLELLVAMAVFLTISGAALALLRQHTPLFVKQQNQAYLNAGMRQALSQLQIDVVNAGSDFTANPNVPLPVFGMTIDAPPAGAVCYDPAQKTYGAGCFDTLHIITLDPNPVYAQTTGSATSTVSVTSSTLFVNPVAPQTADQLAPLFNPGDALLVVQVDQNSNITSMAQTFLDCSNPSMSQAGQNQVKLQHNPQGPSCATNPPLMANAPNNKLGTTFTGGSWVIKLGPTITYGVDVTTDNKNPRLYRQIGNGPQDMIADQIVGFKIGAALNQPPAGCAVTQYYFLAPGNFVCPASSPTAMMDFTQIRALKVSLIGRTAADLNNQANTFDGGRYGIESNSVVIYPRNLANND